MIRRLTLIPLLVLACSGVAPNTSAGFEHTCSVFHGFNFQKDRHDNIGLIESLKIDGIEFILDLRVSQPMDPSKPSMVAAVLSEVDWGGSSTDPITLSGVLSESSMKRLFSIASKPNPKVELDIAFSVYSYDPQSKQYFRSFHTNGKQLNCVLLSDGGKPAIAVQNQPSTEVPFPKVYRFSVVLIPQINDMQIHVAIDARSRLVKRFGSGR